MKFPYSWLKELVDGLPPLDETVELLDGLGLGVEAVHRLPAAPDGVVVAEVTEAQSIEGSEHLIYLKVTDGRREHRVVSGAPNVDVGLRTALALPGTNLPAVDLVVERRVVMGRESEGVVCSPRELGLYDYARGLIEFADDVGLGEQLADLWPAEDVIELELTPNRADAFSLLGVARDLAAKLGLVCRHPAAGAKRSDPTIDDGLRVLVEDEAACPRFTLQLIEGVTVKPSPIWLQRRLASLDLRPRNNVVDVTNYVTFELGQPSHAYDYDALADGTIVVRRATLGEKLTTLNEAELDLVPEDLLITTPDGGVGRAIGLAGVIGGLEDSVSPTTNTVALEAAHFDPATVRKTARRHGQVTDAHYRFERGVDPNLPPIASARAAHLIAELGGGRVHAGCTEVGADRPLDVVEFRPSRVSFLMAFGVPSDMQRTYLEALGCKVDILSEDTWRVIVPSWRFDLALEEDLVEEVARLHGYEHIGESVPNMYFVPSQTDATHRSLRALLVGFGLQETLTYSFSSKAELERAGAPLDGVTLKNPQGLERSMLRTALFPGLLAAANTNRSFDSLALFEIGHVFREEEAEHLCLLLTGAWTESYWREAQPLDFFLLKGLLEKLACSYNATLTWESTEVPHLHPGIAASLTWNGSDVGTAGRVHPAVEARYELGETYVAELKLPLSGRPIGFTDILRQPHAERDLAIVAPVDVAYAELQEIVTASAGEYLESVLPFDVYTGNQIPKGQRSVALRFTFRHPERALNDPEVDSYMGNVMSGLRKAGYDIRG
ncbi:MAG: phenylalanine--tRNA ligase subunit beta [Trueperaceae bacterium]|nr:MAG: phenylalanine--tRNA ligase subunit beta [Trueperaceae bacterium]